MPGGKGGKGKPPGKPEKVANKKPVKVGAKQKQNATKNRDVVVRKDATSSRRDDSEDSYGGDAKTLPPKAGLPGPATKPDPNKWAVKALIDDKDGHRFPEWWKHGALHHQISKAKLQAIGERLEKDCRSDDSTVHKYARQFWSLCCHLAGPEVRDAIGDGGSVALNPIRLLWNMPIMVALGPLNPANDPGQALDPDTEPDPGGDGVRRLTGLSAGLANLERIWDVADAANDGLGFYTGDMWRRMHNALSTARAAAHERDGRGPHLLYPPLVEQWLRDIVGKSEVSVRKGLIRYLGVAKGKAEFRAARGATGGVFVPREADGIIEKTREVRFGGTDIQLVVSVTPETVQHICQRHTLTFFTFAKENLRPVNAFWPGDVTLDLMRYQLLDEYLPSVIEGCVGELKRHTKESLEKGVEFVRAQVPNVGKDTIFFRANAFLEEGRVLVDVKTIAPDGPQAVGFLRAELLEIGQYLEALAAAK